MTSNPEMGISSTSWRLVSRPRGPRNASGWPYEWSPCRRWHSVVEGTDGNLGRSLHMVAEVGKPGGQGLDSEEEFENELRGWNLVYKIILTLEIKFFVCLCVCLFVCPPFPSRLMDRSSPNLGCICRMTPERNPRCGSLTTQVGHQSHAQWIFSDPTHYLGMVHFSEFCNKKWRTCSLSTIL